MPTIPTIIDVEASGFGRGSYPIEVGIALASGRAECFLIRPFDDWTHWTPEAESLHQISRPILLQHGHPPAFVAQRLNDLLENETVYTDAWGVDSSWLALLHARTEIPARYKLETLSRLLDESDRERWGELKLHVRAEMGMVRHRASADALVLQRAYRRVAVL